MKNKTKVQPRPVGRQSLYKPEYNDALIEHMAKGLSFETFAPYCGVHRDTLFEWVKVHPDFSDSYRKAKDLCQLFWEKLLINQATGHYDPNKQLNGGQISGTMFWMRSRANWRDKDPSVINVQTTPVINEEDQKSKVEALIQDIMKRKGKV